MLRRRTRTRTRRRTDRQTDRWRLVWGWAGKEKERPFGSGMKNEQIQRFSRTQVTCMAYCMVDGRWGVWGQGPVAKITYRYRNREVTGSNPISRSNIFYLFLDSGW